jgi:hypothetical protein
LIGEFFKFDLEDFNKHKNEHYVISRTNLKLIQSQIFVPTAMIIAIVMMVIVIVVVVVL